jgi:hypothetical protein
VAERPSETKCLAASRSSARGTAPERPATHGTDVAQVFRMTRPRRSAPGIAFAAVRAGRFQSGGSRESSEVARRETIDIFAAGRKRQATERSQRALVVAAGVSLVALAAVARGLVGAALAIGGVALIARGAGRRSVPRAVTAIARRWRRGSPRDERIDEASWESFPASDPPAHSPAKG